MDLQELQLTVDRWIKNHGGYWDEFEVLARLTEELGEVSSALQRIRGLRPRAADVDLPAEIGDMLFTVTVLANLTEIDLNRIIQDTLKKYDARDSAAWRSAKRNK